MAISIKNPEVERMARALARKRRTTVTGAIKLALSNELSLCTKKRAAIANIQQRIAKQPIDWSLSDDEILGYDENGLAN
jgi:antitoxin VapB